MAVDVVSTSRSKRWVLVGILGYLALSAACAVSDSVVDRLPSSLEASFGAIAPYVLAFSGPALNLAAGALGVEFYLIETLGLAALVGAGFLASRRSVESLAVIVLMTIVYWFACAFFSLVLVA